MVCAESGTASCTAFWGSVVFLVMGLVIGLIVFLLVWRPIRRLLSANARLQQARPFFIRTLFVLLIIAAITPIVGESLDLPEDSAFMEYVWQAAGNLSGTLMSIGLYLFGFVIVMTVLSAALGRYRDE